MGQLWNKSGSRGRDAWLGFLSALLPIDIRIRLFKIFQLYRNILIVYIIKQ